MKRAVMFISLIFVLLSTIFSVSSAQAVLPLPAGEAAYTYPPVSSPVLSNDPSKARPVGVGPAATGGNTVSIRIGLNRISARSDIYFAITAPTFNSETYILGSDGALKEFSEVGLIPWKDDIFGPVDQSLFGSILLSDLPAGIYFLHIAVAPAGSIDRYYIWSTYFLNEAPVPAPTPVCGNDIIDFGEQCDDGNTVGSDGCSSACMIEECGNGIPDSGEECDDGNTAGGDGCSPTCMVEVCGNGILDSGEECDDGNIVSGDGCSNKCNREDPPLPPDDDEVLLENGEIVSFYLPIGQSRLFKAFANGTHNNWPVQVNLEEKKQHDGFGNYDVVIKYAGPNCESGPITMTDYNWVMNDVAQGGAGCHIFVNGEYIDPSSGTPKPREDLYYCLATTSFEFVQIRGNPDQPHGCYYSIVVNAGFLSGPVSEVNFSFTDADAL